MMRSALRIKTILLGIAVIAVSFFVSLAAMNWLAPRGEGPAPSLTEPPPLPAAARSSVLLMPVVIALSGIRDAADRASPRSFAGKADNPLAQILENADIGWSSSRGPLAGTGGQAVCRPRRGV